MSKPIFVNDKTFSVQVGTPSGAGRIIAPGFAVEGDYFLSSWQKGMPLRRLTEEEVLSFNKQRVLTSISLNDSAVQAEAVTPHPAPAPTEVAFVAPPRKLDGVNKTIDETLDQAVKEMGNGIPTYNELVKMNLEQLNALAVRYNVSGTGTRSDIIKQLKAKLSL